MKLIVQIPCYNEAETLEIALNALPRHIEGIDGYSCAGVPLFRRNRYRQSSGRKPLFRNRDTALN